MICKHREQYGEGVDLPAEVSLEHFDTCVPQEARLTVWKLTIQLGEIAGRCIRADHAGALEYLRRISQQRPIRKGRGRDYRRRTRTRTRSRR